VRAPLANGIRKWAVPLILLLADVVAVNLGWRLGLWLRFEGLIPRLFVESRHVLDLPVNLIHIACFAGLGLYHRLWRYADSRDVLRLGLAAGVATAGTWVAAYWVLSIPYPRGALLIGETLILLGVVGTRLLVKLAAEGEGGFRPSCARRVLVVGAGEAGRLVVRELRRHPELRSRPVGFADDDPRKKGMVVAGLRVLADRSNLAQVVSDRNIEEIIIAMPSATRQSIGEWTRLAAKTRARVRLLPGLYELIGSPVDLSKVRDARPEDFLGREPVKLPLDAAAKVFSGRRVLVTGAGGSIGSELCRQLSRLDPALLVLLGNEENQLHELAVDLSLERPQLRLEIVLGDIRDETRMRQVFLRCRPDVVFHAAAHKHVPLLEANPEEAVKNNVLGTRNVALAALEARVETFVYVSTDKAVRPVSVMGAAKRLGEMIVQSLNSAGVTRFVVVRFGNVLGSRGSVLPLFERQLARGGPLTVTHPEATRYFMTLEEAACLLLQTAVIGQGGQVLVLNMGTPVKVLELAENVVRAAGKEPGRDVAIQFIGLRPGEKLHEELLTAYEQLSATTSDRIFQAVQPAPPWTALQQELARLAAALQESGPARVRDLLFAIAGATPEQREAASS